jgi:hypothetical protein
MNFSEKMIEDLENIERENHMPMRTRVIGLYRQLCANIDSYINTFPKEINMYVNIIRVSDLLAMGYNAHNKEICFVFDLLLPERYPSTQFRFSGPSASDPALNLEEFEISADLTIHNITVYQKKTSGQMEQVHMDSVVLSDILEMDLQALIESH